MNFKLAVRILAAAVTVANGPPGGLARAETPHPPEPTIAAISAAWAKRQAALKTVRIAWHEDESTIGFGAVVKALNASRDRVGRRSSGKAISEAAKTSEIVSLKTRGVVCLDDERFAYVGDTSGAVQVAAAKARFRIPSHVQLVVTPFKAEKYYDYRFAADVSDPASGVASARHPESCFELRLPGIQPLILALRPLSARLSFFDLAKYRVSPLRGMIGGQTCVIIEPVDEQPNDQHGQPRRSFWLDPARDYVILRAVVEKNGRCSRQTDIAYEYDGVAGWVPVTWSVLILDGKGHMIQHHKSVRDEFSNGRPLPASVFVIDRPSEKPARIAAKEDHDQHDVRTANGIATSRSGGRLRFVVASNALLAAFSIAVYVAWKSKRASRAD